METTPTQITGNVQPRTPEPYPIVHVSEPEHVIMLLNEVHAGVRKRGVQTQT
jgi:hypothetical protein